MAIYLVDYENVYIDGLQGIDALTEQDSVHIFYTQNRCGLTFALYQQLIACKAEVQLNEVAMSLKSGDPVKNALDIQLMMFTGYLIGAKQAEQIYIISKDKDFLLGIEFYQSYICNEHITLQILPCIRAAFAEPEPRQEEEHSPAYDNFVNSLREKMEQETLSPDLISLIAQESQHVPGTKYHDTVRKLLGKNTDTETVDRVCDMIAVSDTLVDFNNALAKYYRDGQLVKTMYHKCKPKFEELRRLARNQ